MILHIVFKTYDRSSYEIMQYLIEEGFEPIMAVTADNEDPNEWYNQYLILCNATISRMKTFDRTLTKLVTGADLLQYWEADGKDYVKDKVNID